MEAYCRLRREFSKKALIREFVWEEADRRRDAEESRGGGDVEKRQMGKTGGGNPTERYKRGAKRSGTCRPSRKNAVRRRRRRISGTRSPP